MAGYLRTMAACLFLAAAMPAFAADPVEDKPVPAASSEVTYRLSEGEVERILAEAADRKEATEEPDRKIHGEFGIAIGTGEYQAAHGSAVVPLGKGGVAAFSFETSRNDPYTWYEHDGFWRR